MAYLVCPMLVPWQKHCTQSFASWIVSALVVKTCIHTKVWAVTVGCDSSRVSHVLTEFLSAYHVLRLGFN
jgi:hypothetical protein